MILITINLQKSKLTLLGNFDTKLSKNVFFFKFYVRVFPFCLYIVVVLNIFPHFQRLQTCFICVIIFELQKTGIFGTIVIYQVTIQK